MKDNLFWNIVTGKVPMPNAAKLLGWRLLEHLPRSRQVHVMFDATTALTNPLGKVQGGMLAAMLDDCMGPAVYALLDADEVALTVNMSTRFVNPASLGAIEGFATFYRRRGKYCYAKGELRDIRGLTLVTGKACYKILPRPSAT